MNVEYQVVVRRLLSGMYEAAVPCLGLVASGRTEEGAFESLQAVIEGAMMSAFSGKTRLRLFNLRLPEGWKSEEILPAISEAQK
jgi:hypothetical protein